MFASEHIVEKEDQFTTNKLRAGFYLKSVQNMAPKTVMDIGTPEDFYFLNTLHDLLPESKKFALDLYKKAAPPHITMLDKFPDSRIDLTTAFHVLEHVENLHEFLTSIMKSSHSFIIEVPNCSADKQMIRSSTKPHTHFFNQTSLSTLLKSIAPEARIITRLGAGIPLNVSCLTAYLLPNGITIEQDSRRISNLLPRIMISRHLLQPLKK